MHLHTTTSSRGLDISTVHYTLSATSRAGATTTRTGSYQLLGIYLEGVPYRGGAFHVTPSRTYTIVVTASPDRPRYIDASPIPLPPAGEDNLFYPAGHDRWAIGVTLTSCLFAHLHTWNLGVQIAGSLHNIPTTST
jgi:hypothetical protein